MALVFAVLLASAPLRAQPEAAVEPPPVFGDVVDVSVVNVEAVVTRDGEPVHDLRPEHFTLLVDGRTVPIEFFSEIRAGRAVADPVSGTGVSVSPFDQRFAAGESMPRRYLVFIDEYFALPRDRDRVLDGLEADLEQLRAEDRMAIVAWDGRQVELLSGWTASRSTLRAALDVARARPAYGLQRRSEARQVESLLRYSQRTTTGRSFSSIGFNGSRGIGRNTIGTRGIEAQGELRSKLIRRSAAASATLRGFGRPDGRRVLLFLAGGLPEAALSALSAVRDVELRGEPPGPWDSEELVEALVTSANRLGWTIYPVALDETRASELGGAAIGDPDLQDFATGRARARLDLVRDGLREIAAATGAVPVFGGARRHVLDMAADDTRSYYSLGFTPSWRRDDSLHELEIAVAAPDGRRVDVRTRAGFADLSSSTRVTMQVESAHLFGAPLVGGGSLRLEPGTPEPQGRRRMVLPVRLFVPLDQITKLPAGPNGAWASRLELRVVGTDERGDAADVPVITLDLRGERAPAPGEIGTLETRLELRRRGHRLLLALYDPPSARLLGARIEIEP